MDTDSRVRTGKPASGVTIGLRRNVMFVMLTVGSYCERASSLWLLLSLCGRGVPIPVCEFRRSAVNRLVSSKYVVDLDCVGGADGVIVLSLLWWGVTKVNHPCDEQQT